MHSRDAVLPPYRIDGMERLPRPTPRGRSNRALRRRPAHRRTETPSSDRLCTGAALPAASEPNICYAAGEMRVLLDRASSPLHNSRSAAK
jgi:hypothetical protein